MKNDKIEITADEFRETVKRLREENERGDGQNAACRYEDELKRLKIERERVKLRRERRADELDAERLRALRDENKNGNDKREFRRRSERRAHFVYVCFLSAVAIVWIIWEIVLISKFT